MRAPSESDLSRLYYELRNRMMLDGYSDIGNWAEPYPPTAPH